MFICHGHPPTLTSPEGPNTFFYFKVPLVLTVQITVVAKFPLPVCPSFVCFHSPAGYVITHSFSFIIAFTGPDYTISPFLSWCTGTLQIQLNLLRYCGFRPTHPSFKVERFLILPLISLLSRLSAVSGLMQ